MAERIPQSNAIRVPIQAYLAGTLTPATGKTIAITISKNGAAYANPAAGATNATEIGSGSYYVDLATTDGNTLGPLLVKGTSATIDTVFVAFDVVAVASLSLPVTGALAPTGQNFLNPIDIANRACQHCGVTQIDPSLGFTEVSRRAAEISSCYPKLRRAELQRKNWTFATKRVILRAIDENTLLLAPSLWSASATYFVGSIVADSTGYLWISKTPNNLNNQPEETPAAWEPYFGPLSVSLYDDDTAYSSGEVVYTTAGDGTYRVYLSLQSANSDDPATGTAYDATVTYKKNDVVTYSATAYMSKIDVNLGQTPSSSPADWASGTTYAAGSMVNGSDGYIYTSVGSGNVGHDPTTDAGVHWTNTGTLTPWTTVFVGGTGSLKWRQIGGAEFPSGVALSELNIIYPLGAGPSAQSSTRNIYRLPAGFLRGTSQDPKAGSNSAFGAPSGLLYNDWLFERPYIVTSEIGPIMLRFIADVTDVSTMDDMFCEGFAARIALEVCEPLTNSTSKLQTIAKVYSEFMGDARAVNAIEAGSEEAPIDDYLACRY
jgi:hypothetical protein